MGERNQLVSFFPHPSQFLPQVVRFLCRNDKTFQLINIIGIKHGFSCINIRQVPWEVLKTEAEGRRKPKPKAAENRSRRPQFSTPLKGPGEC